MTTLSGFTYWNDIGYIESDRKVPSFSNVGTLPTATGSYASQLQVSADRLFNELQIPIAFTYLENAQYISIRVTYKNGTLLRDYYGWVDSVHCKSDTEDYPMTIIKWHIDPWRTYLAEASYSGGKVERATAISNFTRYKQPVNYQYMKVSDEIGITDTPYIWWIYLLVNYQSGSNPVFTRTYCTPFINSAFLSQPHIGTHEGSDDLATIDSDKIRSGEWSSLLGITLENIKYACISPVPPVSMDYSSSVYRPDYGTWEPTNEMMDSSHQSLYMFKLNDSAGIHFEEYTKDVSSFSINTDELHHFVVTGFDGEVLHEFPFGLSVTGIKYRTVLSSTAGYIEMRGYATGIDEKDARANGLCAVVPLPSLELSDNSTNAYIYSGQRQYDINAATTQRDKALVSGLVSTGKSAMEGAITGSLFPVVGTAVGAVGGAALSVGSAIGNYASSMYFDSVEQGNRDQLYASQPDTMLLSGGGFDFVNYGQTLKVKKLSADQASQDHFSNVISNDGYIIGDYITTNFSTILRSLTGAVKITQLQIGGSIPSYAKDYIRKRFANGVILS